MNKQRTPVRKEELMSGIEKEELAARIKGMTPEEQTIVAGNLPSDILWDELHRRYTKKSVQIRNVRRDVE